jgi:hypothetical protein
MTALLTGVLIGAATWGIYTSWLAPLVGYPLLIVGLFLLCCLWAYLVTRPEAVR